MDFDRSVVVPDDVPPVDPRAVPQVLVVNNVDAPLQDLCHIQKEGKPFYFNIGNRVNLVGHLIRGRRLW